MVSFSCKIFIGFSLVSSLALSPINALGTPFIPTKDLLGPGKNLKQMTERPPVILHAMIVHFICTPVEVKTSRVVGPKEIKSSRPHMRALSLPLPSEGT